jgi:hypothetical protein
VWFFFNIKSFGRESDTLGLELGVGRDSEVLYASGWVIQSLTPSTRKDRF